MQGFREVELIKTLSNPNLRGRLDHLAEVLAEFAPRVAEHRVAVSNRPPARGEALRTIRAVLAEHPAGMRTEEVRALVERRLGRAVPGSTVRGALAEQEAFERIGRGRYRLHQAAT